MKKKLILIILLLLFQISFSDDIVIASFNLKKLGKLKKDYKEIAKIIANFELVAIQEIIDEEGLRKLQLNLQKISKEDWKYHISKKSVGSKNYREYYGFLYKAKKVKVIEKIGFYDDVDNIFLREPYGVLFKSGNFDFILVDYHCIFGKRISQRRKEIENLDKVYKYFKENDFNEKDIIILGDFNMRPYDESFRKILEIDDIYNIINLENKTVLGKTDLSSTYDNFFISYKYTKEFEEIFGVYDISDYDYDYYKKEISDHLPIYTKFNVDFDDD